MIDALRNMYRAGFQAVYVDTTEAARAKAEISTLAEQLGVALYTWDCISGFAPQLDEVQVDDPIEAIKAIAGEGQFEGPALFVLEDFHELFDNPLVRRIVRRVLHSGVLARKDQKRMLVFLSPVLKIHPEISEIVPVEFSLPDREALRQVVRFARESARQSNGESEQRLRDALRTVSALGGCVLLVDEADKVFANSADSAGDSGVGQRLLGKFLSWLQDKQDRTFVVMTMNRVKGIPPELLRKGRFDELFYVDLPDVHERHQIAEIHLTRRGLDPDRFDLHSIVAVTKDFVGSEIEEAIKAARFRAFADGQRMPETSDVLAEAAQIVPLAKLNAEDVQAIREFCRTRARPASKAVKRTTHRSRAVELN